MTTGGSRPHLGGAFTQGDRQWRLRWPTVVRVRGVPWWGVFSSAAAPVLLVTGWTVAAGLQPGGFDQVTGTISALAAVGAADRWVMTLALLGVGICHVITGLALRPAASAGRLLLMTGGIAMILVAVNPVRAGGGRSVPHIIAAAAAFTALAAWPAVGWRRGSAVPPGLRPAISAVAAGTLFGLVGWFAAELTMGGGQVGLAERGAAGAQAVWPLAVVLTSYRRKSLARMARGPRRPGGYGKARQAPH
jgi:hypothetical membrane protein